MLKLKSFVKVSIVLLTATVLIGVAYAQTEGANDGRGTIDLTSIIVALINLVFPAVAGIATYLVNRHLKDRQMATLLSNAIQNGLGIVQQRTSAAARGAHLTVDVANPDIRAGIQYVLDNAKEAIEHFDIPQERIAQKLEAKLGLAEIATNLATTASPAPIIAGPLAPAPMGRIVVESKAA